MDARHTALAQIEAELALSSIDVPPFVEEDRVRASIIGKSLTGAIGMAALILFRQGKDNPVKLALALEDYRLRRVAATEVPHAYSRMHYDVTPEGNVERRWDATLESGTCSVCSHMDGETTPVGTPFSGGLVPGDTHPHCRCIPTFIKVE